MGNSTETKTASGSGHGTKAIDRATNWILLDGKRLAVAGGLLLVILALFILLELAHFMTTGRNNYLGYVFSGLIGGNLTILTVVLAINQLILSRQLKPLGEAHSELQSMVEYQHEVEGERQRQIAPITPLDFIDFILQIVCQQIQIVSERSTEIGDPQLRDDITMFVDRLTEQIDDANASIEQSDGSIFEVLLILIRMDIARPIYTIRQLRTNHRESLSDAEHEALEELVHRLQQLDIAQQYFKTVYVQEELARLSRHLLYVGIPAVVISLISLVALSPSVSQQVSLSLAPSGGQTTAFAFRSIYLNTVILIGLIPLTVLSVFVLRIATVAQYTAITTPFTREGK